MMFLCISVCKCFIVIFGSMLLHLAINFISCPSYVFALLIFFSILIFFVKKYILLQHILLYSVLCGRFFGIRFSPSTATFCTPNKRLLMHINPQLRAVQLEKIGLFLIPFNSHNVSLSSLWLSSLTQKHFCMVLFTQWHQPFTIHHLQGTCTFLKR